MGTWARLGYTIFDAQIQKAYFVTTLYVCLCMHKHAMLYRESLHPVLVM